MSKGKPDPHYRSHEKEVDPSEHAPKIRKLLEGIEAGKIEVICLAEMDSDGSPMMIVNYRKVSK